MSNSPTPELTQGAKTHVNKLYVLIGSGVVFLIAVCFIVIYLFVLKKDTCKGDSDCVTNSKNKVCDMNSKSCVECISDENCGRSSSKCDTKTKTCVCGVAAKCITPQPICDGNTSKCVACLEDIDCPDADYPYCDTTSNSCYQCDETAGGYHATCSPGLSCNNKSCDTASSCKSSDDCSPGQQCYDNSCADNFNDFVDYVPNTTFPTTYNYNYLYRDTTAKNMTECTQLCNKVGTACSKAAWDFKNKTCDLFTGTDTKDMVPKNESWSAVDLNRDETCTLSSASGAKQNLSCGKMTVKNASDKDESFYTIPSTFIPPPTKPKVTQPGTKTITDCYRYCKDQLSIDCDDSPALGVFQKDGTCACYDGMASTIDNIKYSITADATIIAPCWTQPI